MSERLTRSISSGRGTGPSPGPVASASKPALSTSSTEVHGRTINSGGAAGGDDDLAQAVRTAVINKRAGGMGLISGRKAFQRPIADGVELLQTIQDVYRDESITVA